MEVSKYYRIDLEYIQRTSLLVSATTVAEANEMVSESVDPTVEGFKIISTTEISEEEKTEILESINQKGRTIN